MWRIESSDTTIEGTRDLDSRVTEKVFSQRAEGMPSGYLGEEMCIHGAMVDGDLDLGKTLAGMFEQTRLFRLTMLSSCPENLEGSLS